MGRTEDLRTYSSPSPVEIIPPGAQLKRRRPRAYYEWKALRRWGKLPGWEISPPGYLLRLARERASLTQSGLASRLRSTQQAVAQAERWDANPTVAFMERWANACGARLTLEIE
ncbi:MAG: helix-turn-helix transcriptional regulator [Thermoanaerobaculia bacterium]|nr:helix-turn-helix transcriptional regulator [Thermoanaerobaculia bacterium]